jgi:hypothetical protein
VQSKMILAMCVMLFTMCALWTMAVPKRPQRAPEAVAGPAQPAAAPAAPRSLQGEHVDGLWSPAGFGLRLTAPAAWRPTRSRGRARLLADLGDPLRGQFELSAHALLSPQGLAARADALQAALSAQSGFELLGAGAAQLGAHEARRLEWRARGAGGATVRSIALLWISGPQELLLVFSAADSRWSEVEPVAAAALAGVEFGPRTGAGR